MGIWSESGRGFVQKDLNEMRKVVLVDDNAAENLFAGENPVGKTIEIGSEPFTVVGVVQQSDDYLPNIKTIDEFNEYYQTIMGTVMIPETTWPTVFQFDEPQNAVITCGFYRQYEFCRKCSSGSYEPGNRYKFFQVQIQG